MKEAFITGSHAYGVANEDSDIDLVVFVDATTKDFLTKHGGKPTRFGKLNIIAVSDKAQFEAWRKGTDELMTKSIFEGPVDRETAKAKFTELGVNRSEGEPSGIPDSDRRELADQRNRRRNS